MEDNSMSYYFINSYRGQGTTSHVFLRVDISRKIDMKKQKEDLAIAFFNVDELINEHDMYRAEKVISVIDPANDIKIITDPNGEILIGFSHEADHLLTMPFVPKDKEMRKRLLLEFPDDKSALLWFKLEYGG
jgi:hypothetical protein